MCTDARLISDEMLRTLKALWRGDCNRGRRANGKQRNNNKFNRDGENWIRKETILVASIRLDTGQKLFNIFCNTN